VLVLSRAGDQPFHFRKVAVTSGSARYVLFSGRYSLETGQSRHSPDRLSLL